MKIERELVDELRGFERDGYNGYMDIFEGAVSFFWLCGCD